MRRSQKIHTIFEGMFYNIDSSEEEPHLLTELYSTLLKTTLGKKQRNCPHGRFLCFYTKNYK